ncbi:MAG: M28 family peptidase [Clostridiales bacterium]|nr:M28 family peptidase [Clostridiales bacterium]
MKKIIRILLVLSALLAFASCADGGLGEAEAGAGTPPPIIEESPPETLSPPEPELYENSYPALSDVWNFSYFENNTDPFYLSDEAPHGDVSMGHIEFISDNLYDRVPFSYRELETAVWIVEELLAMGYAWDDIKIQEFNWQDVAQLTVPWTMIEGQLFEGHELRQISQNIILTIPGQSTQTIIVGAHYDSWVAPGADDNASGTALLLESALRMLRQEQYYTLVYVFFGAHEIGMLGAYYHLESLSEEQRDNLVLMINADVLLGTHFFYRTGFIENYAHAENNVSQKIHEIADELRAAYDIDLTFRTVGLDVAMGRDAWLFKNEGFTVLDLVGVNVDEYGEFFGIFIHTELDCIHHHNEFIPGMAARAMWFFSMFLERALLAVY